MRIPANRGPSVKLQPRDTVTSWRSNHARLIASLSCFWLAASARAKGGRRRCWNEGEKRERRIQCWLHRLRIESVFQKGPQHAVQPAYVSEVYHGIQNRSLSRTHGYKSPGKWIKRNKERYRNAWQWAQDALEYLPVRGVPQTARRETSFRV